MSRVGKQPIPVPSGVKVSVSGGKVTVEGPKGTLTMEHRPEVSVAWNEDEKSVVCTVDEQQMGEREVRAYWGMTRSLIANMIQGVKDGYKKQLEVVGVGWGAQVQGQQLKLNVGYASPVFVNIPTGVTVTVEKQLINVEGADKQAVGQFAAETRSMRKPEPYNGKGIKYADEVVRRKEGKQFGA